MMLSVQHYVRVSVDEAAKMILKLGRNTQLAKIIQPAYRIVPVLPEAKMASRFSRMASRSRSAPEVFNVIADTLEWIMHN